MVPMAGDDAANGRERAREVLLRVAMVLVAWYVGASIGFACSIASEGGEGVGRLSTYQPSLLWAMFILSVATPWAQVAWLVTVVVGGLFPWLRWPRWVSIVPLAGSALTIFLMRAMWRNF